MNKENILNLKQQIVLELSGWTRFEVIFLCSVLGLIFVSSHLANDSILAIVISISGILYTTLAGKGKTVCYLFGIIDTLCGSYLLFKTGLYGNFILHLGYYFPMEVIGIFAWQKHLKKSSNEIIKSKLTPLGRVITVIGILASTLITFLVLRKIGGNYPFIDALVTILAIAGMFLTVRRCIEQWVVWTMLNLLSVLMWFNIYNDGERIFSILIMRFVYLFLGIYFYIQWKNDAEKEIEESA